jgi:hypothetical protein
MLPKLDEYGQPTQGTKGVKQERHKLEVFQEYYISDVESIKTFINLTAVNADFDYLSFVNA